MMVTTLNNTSYTLLFLVLLFSSSSDRLIIFILALSIYNILLIFQLFNIQKYLDLQAESSKSGFIEAIILFLLSLVFATTLFLYLALFRIAQSLLSHLFFEIYKRVNNYEKHLSGDKG
ncbi:MAG: hypothetical protein QXD88_00160 [Candidatus Anstonellales archaeon]